MLIGGVSSAVTYLTNYPAPWAGNGGDPLHSKFESLPPEFRDSAVQQEPANNPLGYGDCS